MMRAALFGLLAPVAALQVRALPGRRPALAAALSAAGSLLLPLPEPAVASGGATAGKTTSIPRAKLRYYGRMTAVVAAFEALEGTIGEDGQQAAAKRFFNADDPDSPFSELKSAGYLLAVAFKLDSKIPPDKLQTVKNYKAAMSDQGELKKAMGAGKKKQEDASKVYAKAQLSLTTYLEGVELPPLGDLGYASPTACTAPAKGPCAGTPPRRDPNP